MDIKDLDVVLKTLDEVESRPSLTYQGIFDILGENIYTDKQLDLILAKLVKDKYVNKKFGVNKTTKEKTNLGLFHITYDGHIFLKEGGYSEFVKSQQREKRRQIILDYALIFGGVGAVIVAIPYLIELFKYIFFCCC